MREPIVRAMLKERKEASDKKFYGNQYASGVVQVPAPHQNGKSREKIADVAKVSHDTYERAKKIIEKAPPEILQDLREGKRSIAQTERELRVGTRIREFCGEEKPLSRFQNEGGKKVEKPKVQNVDDKDGEEPATLDIDTLTDTQVISETPPATPPQNTIKRSIADIALGTPSSKTVNDSKEYRDELQKTRDNVKQMAEYSRNHKRTIAEFQQVFQANAERLVDSIKHQFKFMDAETWVNPANKQIACDQLDELVQAITNFKEEFLTWK